MLCVRAERVLSFGKLETGEKKKKNEGGTIEGERRRNKGHSEISQSHHIVMYSVCSGVVLCIRTFALECAVYVLLVTTA